MGVFVLFFNGIIILDSGILFYNCVTLYDIFLDPNESIFSSSLHLDVKSMESLEQALNGV